MHWQGAAKIAAGVASISWKDGIEDHRHQEAFVQAFVHRQIYGPALMRALRHDQKAVIFTRECMLAVFRLALVEMSEGDANADLSDAFTRACLSVNTLLSDEITPGEVHSDARDLLASELRSIVAQPPNIFQEIGRTDAFVQWLATSDAMASKQRMPVLEDFTRFTDLTPDEYIGAAWTTMGRCAALTNWDKVDQDGVAFTLDTWLSDVGDQRCMRAFFEANAVELTTAQEIWRNESSLSYAAAKPLWMTPIVKAEDDLFCVPAPGLLINKMGDGIYFTMFDGYREESEPEENLHLRFSQFWSEFFEDYVYERFRDGFVKRPDVFVFPEQIEDGDASTDVIIVENGDVMFIEVVAKRLNLLRSVVGLDDVTIEKDLNDGIRHKMCQLNRNIKLFRDRKLLRDVPRKEGFRVFPIIASPSEWPRAYTLMHFVPQVLNETGWLKDCEPLELLDVAEVERLEGLAGDGHSVTQLLWRKHTYAHDRIQSLHNYITTRERSMLSAPVPRWIKGSEAARRAIDLAMTWATSKAGPSP
jgi:hypothetical protein